jgi:hypothetical protein
MPKPKNSGLVFEEPSSRKSTATQDDPIGAAMSDAKSETIAATEAPLKSTPAWSDWNERHTISLFNAVCLLHNIRPSRSVLAKLREQKDPRALKFQNHLNTLLDRVPIEPLLKRTDSDKSERPTEKTKVVLKDFIVWVKSKQPFTGLIPPPAFFEIQPYESFHSSAEQVSVADTRESTGKSVPELSVGEVSSDGDGKDLDSRQVGTLSRILLAVVIKHYGFRPFDAALTKNQEKAKDAVYEPIYLLCKSLGFLRPKGAETVSDVLRAAAAKIGPDEVQSAYEEWTKSIVANSK